MLVNVAVAPRIDVAARAFPHPALLPAGTAFTDATGLTDSADLASKEAVDALVAAGCTVLHAT